jgi:cell division protein FtsI (penicillin-binding protein 3)
MNETVARGTQVGAWRRWFVLSLLLLGAVGLVWRSVYLQWVNQDFLQNQGDARHLRVMELAANRGMIVDRNNEPLAISTPVDSVWVNPKLFLANATKSDMSRLAQLLEMKPAELKQKIGTRTDREFVYVKRHVAPALAERVERLGVAGVALQREYRRYYPMAEVTGHVVGFTSVDDEGQEGVELAFDEQLRGTRGAKRVLRDSLGNVVENVESIAEPLPGKDLVLSIDRRIQYLAYRELKAAVQTHRAKSASAVILDVQTGEVLAMVNQPTFNPNNRGSFEFDHYRNRAVTDVFEPGSTMKSFTVAAALEAGKITPHTVIDTTPGYYRLGRNTIRDAIDYGAIDVATILQKSSNIGATKIALSLTPEQLWRTFDHVGFGVASGSRFPGEAHGVVGDYGRWKQIQQASHSYGYGMSVTALQLARAYSVLAGDGVLKPVSFVKVDEPPLGEQVMPAEVARQVRSMLESVVADRGTGKLARVSGYRIAGKTGTVHRSTNGGYADDRFSALFAGMAPATKPRLAMVVVIHEPAGNEYHGGSVAAPVFSRVMTGALRLLNVAPDDLESLKLRQASVEGEAANERSYLLHTAAGGGR